MKRNGIKATALILSTAILLGAGATAAYAKNEPAEETPIQEKPVVISAKPERSGKDETVYVFSGADGTAQKVLVSNWLRNPEKAQSLEDQTTLENIENVKGDETYAADKNGNLIWNTNGADIYYQGTTQQDVPVALSISYTLNGQKIAPDDLAGKSGHVTIRFDYENKSYRTVKIKGRNEKIYVPFAMVTGTMLDTEHFQNVTVKNGKLENLGNDMVVMGIALPGMQHNLDLDEKDLEIPQYIEISADVTEFEMGPTMTLATTSLLQNIDTEDLSVEKLTDAVKKMTDGMNQLMDGSDRLYDGLNTLLDQAKVLVAGIDQLSAGATQLKAGADALNGGASQLQSGAAQLSKGLSTLNSKSGDLNNGAKQVFNSLLSSAETQLKAAGIDVPHLTIGNYASVLNGVIASLDENAVYQAALEQVTAGVNARRGEIEAAVTAAVQKQVEAEVLAQVTAGTREKVTAGVQAQEAQFRAAVVFQATGMTLEQYEAAVAAGLVTPEQQAAIETAVEAAMTAKVAEIMESEEIQAQITAMTAQITAQKMQTPEIQALIAENTEAQVQKAISDTMASPEVQAKLQAAAEGSKAVIALKSSLDSYNGFYLGLQAYTAGVGSATAGAKELIGGADTLKGGMETLTSGAGDLSSGIQTMKSKTPALLDGVTQLRDGSGELKDGLCKLMQEGIQKLADLTQKDLENLVSRLSATIDAGKSYTTFSGVDSSAESSVKFIYKTDSIPIEK